MAGIQQEDRMNRAVEEGVREGIWKVTAKIKDHLNVCVETKYSGSFLKYISMKKYKLNQQLMGKTARHLTSPNESSSSGNVLHLIELLAKRFFWTPQAM